MRALRVLLATCFAGFVVALSASSAVASTPADDATTTPIKHFLFLMQENHSFDNYFGTYPGADGIPGGVCQARDLDDPSAGCVAPFHIANRAVTDLAHSPTVHAQQLDGGKMDGFVAAHGATDSAELAMGHYEAEDLPYYWNLADNYVLFDKYFSSAPGGSVRNHMYWVSGVGGVQGDADVVPSAGWGDSIRTVFDELNDKGISWKFYVQNYDPTVNIRSALVGDKGAQVVWVPLLAMDRFIDDPALAGHIVDMSQYYTDLENNTLPAVSYMVPSGASEHPPGSIQAGQAFVRTITSSLMRSDAWSSSAFMWSYDDWGGFYDHVAPPAVDGDTYGFRVPALLVSPYARKGFVDHTLLDFTSGLVFIRENWGVEALGARDAESSSFMQAFDFTGPPRKAALLAGTRDVVRPKKANIAVLYPAYAVAVAIPGAFALIALRRRRSSAPVVIGVPS